MPEQIKAVDSGLRIPGAYEKQTIPAETAARVEKANNRNPILDLFPGMAERLRGLTPERVISEMDELGVEKAILTTSGADTDGTLDIIKKYAGRFIAGTYIDPVRMGLINELNRVKSLVKDHGMQLIKIFVSQLGVPCTDARLFPFYTLAMEYDVKVQINVGYPGPSGLARLQHPLYVDELCYVLPELKVIQSHYGHPWTEEAIHNVIKYPNCYLNTNEYRPKYFSPEFIQHLNTRAQDKILWASGFPSIDLKTSLDDIRELPLRDQARVKFLRENALRLFKFA